MENQEQETEKDPSQHPLARGVVAFLRTPEGQWLRQELAGHLSRVSSDVLGYSMPSSATKLTSEQMRENAIFASGARAILEDVFSTYLGGVP
jgi:hypothetical protein